MPIIYTEETELYKRNAQIAAQIRLQDNLVDCILYYCTMTKYFD